MAGQTFVPIDVAKHPPPVFLIPRSWTLICLLIFLIPLAGVALAARLSFSRVYAVDGYLEPLGGPINLRATRDGTFAHPLVKVGDRVGSLLNGM